MSHSNVALNESASLPAQLPAEIVPPSKRSGGVSLPPNAVPVLPVQPPVQPSAKVQPPAQTGVDYSALSDLNSTESSFANFSSFSSPAPPSESAAPSMNLITPPTPQAPILSSAAPSTFPAQTGPIPNLLTGGVSSVPPAEVPYLVTPDKYG